MTMEGRSAPTLRRAGAYTASLGGSQLAAAAALVLLSIVIARGLGPERYGVYVLFIAMSTVLAIPLSWLSSVVTVFGQEDLVSGRSASGVVGALVIYSAMGLAAVAVLATIFAPVVAIAFPEPAALLDLAVAYVVASAVSSATLGTLQARAAMHRYAVVSFLSIVVPQIGAVVALAVSGPQVRSVVTGYVAGQAVAVLPFAVQLARRFPRPAFVRARVRAIGSFVAAYLAGSVQGQLSGQADVLVVGLLLDPAGIGSYGLATRLYRQLVAFAQVFATVGLPLVNDRRIRARDADVLVYVERRSPQIVSFVALGASMLTLAGVVAIPVVFGAGFKGAIGAFVALMVSVPLAVWRRLVSPVLTAYQLIWEANLAALGSAAVLVAALIALVPLWSAAGAGLAVSIAAVADLGIALALVHRRLGGTTPPAPIAMTVASIVLIALPAAFVGNLPLAAATLLLSLGAYVLCVRALGLFHPGDMESLAPGNGRADAVVRAMIRPFVRG